MFTEFEVKFYPIDKVVYRKLLMDKGAKCTAPERKFRRWMISRYDYPQLTCDYIRVRDESGVVRLSAKTHASAAGTVSDQKEIDVVVNSYDDTVALLTTMGYTRYSYQETMRETWMLDGAEITIDTWPGLSPFTEIEARSEDEVKTCAKKLGYAWNEKIITSVIELYMSEYSIDRNAVLENMRNLTFERMPFRKAA